MAGGRPRILDDRKRNEICAILAGRCEMRKAPKEEKCCKFLDQIQAVVLNAQRLVTSAAKRQNDSAAEWAKSSDLLAHGSPNPREF